MARPFRLCPCKACRDVVPWSGIGRSTRVTAVKNKPKLIDVMSPEPITVDLGQPISDVYALFQAVPFHHVPVVDGQKPVGLISATDILKLVYDVEGHEEHMLRTFLDHQFTLEDAMSTDLITAKSDEPLRVAVDHMSTGEVHSVLVIDDNGELAGIVTSTDLIRLLQELL
jgi:CBS domain-containing protein